MNGGNKLALAIRLMGESILEIEFMHWDKRFLSKYNNEDIKDDKFVYFESEDKKFCMYSHEDGYIIDDGQFGFIVPDADHMKPGVVLTHEFRNDGVRKRFLETMYEHLVEWAIDWDTFKDDEKPTHKFIVHEQYWIF